jgi:hypothetical protein
LRKTTKQNPLMERLVVFLDDRSFHTYNDSNVRQYQISAISLAGMTSQIKNNSEPTCDFGAKCDKCETTDTITLETGELEKQI